MINAIKIKGNVNLTLPFINFLNEMLFVRLSHLLNKRPKNFGRLLSIMIILQIRWYEIP